jgi:hypothetical protein
MSAPKRTSTGQRFIFAVIFLAMTYPLSMGPAFWMIERVHSSNLSYEQKYAFARTVQSFYSPIQSRRDLLPRHIDGLIRRYLLLWE